ncbi:MAG: FtsX-like permease family protein [Lachnospiraceae bacterium]|jgi:putative ABC transport system permease protein|nr:FtsX-like permease family protein [Lachnospiraceae bacterium]
MNIISRMTVQHLKQNKKRTIVTILGIMLSVALIMAISAFAESFLDLMRQQEIASDGEWHVDFDKVAAEQIPEITEDPEVKKTLVSREMGAALLEGCENEAKPYLAVRAYDQGAMEEYPLTLLEGRLPQAAGEIVLPKHLETNGGIDWKVGDTITLNLGIRMIHSEEGDQEAPVYYPYYEGEETLENTHEGTYTVVGIIERPTFEGYSQGSYTAITWLDVENLGAEERVTVQVQVKDLDNGLFDWGDRKAEALNLEHNFNNSLLSFYMLSGNDTIVTMLSRVKWVMMLIVAAGSVAVIYSSFAISISERSRYLGMLASVGATKRQKRNSVFTEAVLLGLIGIPLGLLLGFAGVFVTTRCIRGLVSSTLGDAMGMEHVAMRVIVSWPGILGAVVLAAVTILVSAWIPAKRASKITPVEAIRQNQDIKLSGRQVKTSRLTRKLFGFEGELALKNLKRNKKRYRAAVLSLIFCIALYLSVASFTAYLKGAYRMGIGAASVNPPDISVTIYPEPAYGNGDEALAEPKEGEDEDAQERARQESLEERIAKIRAMDHITQCVTQVNRWIQVFLADGENLSEDTRKALEESEGEVLGGKNMGPYLMNVDVVGLDKESLSAFADQVGADKELLFDGSKKGVILINRRGDLMNGRRSWKEIWDVKAGETVEGTQWSLLEKTSELPEDGVIARVDDSDFVDVLTPFSMDVAGVTTELPLGAAYSDDINHILVYTTIENAMSFDIGGNDAGGERQLLLMSDDYETLLDDLSDMRQNEGNLYAYSYKKEMESMNNVLLLINVFVYGFIILTALICVTSIFNTISTSMALRRREYAMLKSVGMDPRRFNRMIAYESVFYGLKALLYGLPIGLLLMLGIYTAISSAVETGFYILWNQVIAAIVSVMLVVGVTMWYSSRKIKKANIVDVLKNENI